ncbi:hypothetical protein chiPu_0014314 [Chiloscyllium punctatum]|uniref:FZ domain-containing protein n=1 Tax=Chiloscyllium punctatum TaxID=137246 RepID=A0A401SZL4_CHIPU|nr:hypothetical protein [Chiloscyllium punctatum]
MMQRLHAKLLLLLLLAGLASGYYIETYNETYYCEDPIVVCVPPHFNFSENCKEEWTKLPMKIAIASSANSSKPQCHPHVYEKRIFFSGLNKGEEPRYIEENLNTRRHQCIYYIPLIGVLVVITVYIFWYNK